MVRQWEPNYAAPGASDVTVASLNKEAVGVHGDDGGRAIRRLRERKADCAAGRQRCNRRFP